MRDFDKAMKFLITSAVAELLPQIGIEGTVSEWLNVELPARKRQADLIARLVSGAILHFELQSKNDPNMSRRMLDYCVRIFELTGVMPHQVVLYFGTKKMRMKQRLEGPGIRFAYTLIDMRNLDSEALLASGSAEAAILSLLTEGCDPTAVSRQLSQQLGGDDESRNLRLQDLFLILCSLRGFDGPGVLQMPLDIMDVPIIQEYWKKGKAEGKVAGLAEALLRQADSRFGPLPEAVRHRILHASTDELLEWLDSVHSAGSLDSLIDSDRQP